MKNIKGLTILEGLIVIVWIGLFAAISIPLYKTLTRDSRSPEIKRQNETILSFGGELVGKLPDGRVVSRYEIQSGTSGNHWVYVISDNSSVSVNRSVSSGKITRNETVVIINGKEYIEKNAN